MRYLITLFTALAGAAFAAEWKPMFNGKDLTGWDGDPKLWSVVDGVITGETDDAGRKVAANTFLIWKGGEPADFEMEFKARVTGNNSGVQYRSNSPDPTKWVVGGYQFDLHPDKAYLGMLYEERGRGIACTRGQKVKLADGPQETGKLDVEDVNLGEWNSYRIVAKGNVLQHYVNGKLAAEIEDVSDAKKAMKGIIALQLHAGPPMKAEFKDLRWRPLGDAAKK